MKLTHPTVHLNGTAGQVLEGQFCDVVAALRRALDFAHEAAPNARDYYVQGTDAFQAAANQHTRRVERLQAVLTEYAELLDAVIEQRENTAALQKLVAVKNDSGSNRVEEPSGDSE